MYYRLQKRIVILFKVFALVFFLLLAHLGYLQLVQGDKYTSQALKRQSYSVSLEQVERGLILDRDGHPLTDPVVSPRVVVFPHLLTDKTAVAAMIARVLGKRADEIAVKIGSIPVVLPYQINSQNAAMIKSKNIPGVTVMPYMLRYGPRSLAVHLVGFVDEIYNQKEWKSLESGGLRQYQLGDMVGKKGLEKIFESSLKGNLPERLGRVYIDGKKKFIAGLGYKAEESIIDPFRANLVTTINKRIQEIVEDVMDAMVEEGAVVVLDPKKGDVLAMASRPAFNQNNPVAAKEGAFLNNALQKYPPGSVFKVVLAAAALEKKVATENTIFVCTGRQDPYVKCIKDEGHGVITFARALIESCNPSFARVGIKLGGRVIAQFAVQMGFDHERMSLIEQPDNIVNSSIGQWPVEASPLEVAAMMNTIASGGAYRQPRVALNLQTSNGKIIQKFPEGTGKKIFSLSTVETLKKILEIAVEEGTGKEARVKGLRIAGKTGSAQVTNKGLSHAWFAGFVPADKPSYTIVVFVKEGGAGGTKAAPVFREIVKKLY